MLHKQNLKHYNTKLKTKTSIIIWVIPGLRVVGAKTVVIRIKARKPLCFYLSFQPAQLPLVLRVPAIISRFHSFLKT